MEYSFWIPTVISVASIIWNYKQSRQIISLETEAEAKKLIHKYQFEKEFSIYNELWTKLIDLRNAAASLRPFMDYIDKSKTEEEIKKERLKELYDKFNVVVKAFEYNRPFYASSVYKEVEKVLRTSRVEAVDYEHMDKTREYWKKAEENITNITNSVDKISDLIRKRIEFDEKK